MPANLRKLQDQLTLSKRVQENHWARWSLNAAAYAGQYWVMWERISNTVRPVVRNENKVYYTVNFVKKNVRADIANLMQTRPSVFVVPSSSDEKDRNAARAGQQVFEYYWDKLTLNDELFRALLFSRIFGDGFWYLGWDSSRGKSYDVITNPDGGIYRADAEGAPDENGMPVRAGFEDVRFRRAYEALEGRVPTKSLAEGDICAEALTPFEFFPEPNVLRLDKMMTCTRGQVKPREQVMMKYGVQLQASSNAAPGVLGGWSTNTKDLFGFSPQNNVGEVVTVYESWYRPGHALYPNGGRCIWTEEKILHEEETFPFGHGELPFMQFSADVQPTSFFAGTPIDDVRDINVEINKLMSQIIEVAKRNGNPALLVPRHSRVNYQGRPGEVIHYEANVPDSAPSYLQGAQFPGWIQQLPERLEQDARQVGALQEVTADLLPREVSAAAALSQLNEAGLVGLRPAIRQAERALERAGRQMLQLFKEFVREDRAISIAGDNSEWWVDDLRGSEIHTDLRVESGSGVPRTIAGKRQAVMDIIQSWVQLRKDPTDEEMKRLFEKMEFGDVTGIYTNVDVEKSLIDYETRWMIDNVQPHPGNAEIDDHEVHYIHHSEFEKTDRFRGLPPQVQEAMRVHRRMHKQMMEFDMQEEQLKQEEMMLRETAARGAGNEQSMDRSAGASGGGDRGATGARQGQRGSVPA